MASRKDEREGARNELLAALAAELALAADPDALFAERTPVQIKGRVQALQDGQSMLREPLVSAHVAADFHSVPEIVVCPKTGEIYFIGVMMQSNGSFHSEVYKVGPCGPILLEQTLHTHISGLHFPTGSTELAWISIGGHNTSESKSILFQWGEDTFDLGLPKTGVGRMDIYRERLHVYVDANGAKHVVDLNKWRSGWGEVVHQAKIQGDIIVIPDIQEPSMKLEYATVIDGHRILVVRIGDGNKASRQIHWYNPEGKLRQHELPADHNVQHNGFVVRDGYLHFVQTNSKGFNYCQMDASGWSEGIRRQMPEGSHLWRAGDRLMMIQRSNIGSWNPSFSTMDLLSGHQYGGEEHIVQGEFKDIRIVNNVILLLWQRDEQVFWTRWGIDVDGLPHDIDSLEARGNEWLVEGGTHAERLVVHGESFGFVIHTNHKDPKLVWEQDSDRRGGLEQELRDRRDKLTWVEAFGRFVSVHFGSGTIYVRAFKPPFED